ncbi:hypothetical protein WN943_018421 [Citrus x changshan-huyou]
MSEKSSRHQRRPSQGVFINFDDLSSPISDNVAGAPDQLQAQPSDDHQIRSPLPPSSAPTPRSVIVKDDGKEKPRDVKKLCSFACLFVVVVEFYNCIASHSAAFAFLGEIAMRLYHFSHCIHGLKRSGKEKFI